MITATKLPVPRLSSLVRSGLLQIDSEMGAVADCKAGEDADGKRSAKAIRAALEWIERWKWIIEESK